MSKLRKVHLSLALLVMVGCEEQSFKALGCEWQRPEGYTDSPKRMGYERLVPGSRESPSFIRYYYEDPGKQGELLSKDVIGDLIVEHFKVPLNSNYSAGDESFLIRRPGHIGRVIINEEFLETFLVRCQ